MIILPEILRLTRYILRIFSTCFLPGRSFIFTRAKPFQSHIRHPPNTHIILYLYPDYIPESVKHKALYTHWEPNKRSLLYSAYLISDSFSCVLISWCRPEQPSDKMLSRVASAPCVSWGIRGFGTCRIPKQLFENCQSHRRKQRKNVFGPAFDSATRGILGYLRNLRCNIWNVEGLRNPLPNVVLLDGPGRPQSIAVVRRREPQVFVVSRAFDQEDRRLVAGRILDSVDAPRIAITVAVKDKFTWSPTT